MSCKLTLFALGPKLQHTKESDASGREKSRQDRKWFNHAVAAATAKLLSIAAVAAPTDATRSEDGR